MIAQGLSPIRCLPYIPELLFPEGIRYQVSSDRKPYAIAVVSRNLLSGATQDLPLANTCILVPRTFRRNNIAYGPGCNIAKPEGALLYATTTCNRCGLYENGNVGMLTMYLTGPFVRSAAFPVRCLLRRCKGIILFVELCLNAECCHQGIPE